VSITAGHATATQFPYTTLFRSSWSGTGDEDHPYLVTITATNADGSIATTSFNVSFTDVKPQVAADNASVSAAENKSATNTGTFSSEDDTATIPALHNSVTRRRL